jgi:1-acyl-sn-glycerol-3-phosphate acyltransferase
MLKLNPGWTFEIRGADHSKIPHPTIVVANHQSFLDMPLIYLLPWSMKWVAKKSLFRIPILGWIIYMTGHLGIDRKSMRSVKKLDKLVEPIQEGIPAMIFPEGTRTQTGDLKAFKNGAYKMAKQYNFNILPIVLHGGYQAMPSGEWRLNFQQHFVLSVLEPIAATEFGTESELKNAVFTLIERELKSLQKSKRGSKRLIIE